MGDSTKPSGGGTGFLFGNIDRRGRLDEDYMEEEAKDQLDNVGTAAVRGGDEGMKAVVDAVPKRSGESDDEAQVHGEGAEDFYDEDEVMELDAREREVFAKKALEGKGEDEEEDYDDDEDEGDDEGEVKVKPMGNVPVLKKFVAGEPGTVKAPPVPIEATSEERMQAELMEEARRKAALVAGGGGEEEMPVSADAATAVTASGSASDKPLRFSEVLQRPRRVMRKRARPRRFGVMKDAVSAMPAADDALLFDRTPLLPGVDPTSIFLDSDAAALARKGEDGSPAVGAGGGSAKMDIGGDGDGDGDSDDDRGGGGAPLDPNCGAQSDVLLGGERGGDAEGEEDNRHSLLQQVAWEADIAWEGDTVESDDSGSSEIDDDVDDGGAPPTACAKKGVAKGAGNGHDGGGGDGADDDSDDDDDMEWEDGGATAAASPAAGSSGADAGPTTSSAGPEKLASSSPVSKADGDGTAAFGANGTVSAEAAATTVVEAKTADATLKKPPELDLGILVTSVIASNKDLADGRWLKDVDWDSSECDSDASDITPFTLDISKASSGTTRGLILNLNDRQMCLEEVKAPVVEFDTASRVVAGMQAMTVSVEGRRLAPLTAVKPVLDVFDVSNDPYYAPDMGGSMLKVDRRAILRGMRNAPPAVKAQTSIPCVPEPYLESFHRPRLLLSPKSKLSRKLEPIRRKRPKGGITQIAGQVPKKENDLLTSGKDAYRVCLSEYALEASPTLIPIPGMASKLVTYQRKGSAAAATQARRDATGTPDADTIFLSPEEVPPVHAGDLTPKDPPLLVLESHIFSAPCTRGRARETDFLIIRRKDKMFVRTIDSTLSVGVTEPKLEVMAPNSERFKKFARDRVSLWLLREFTKSDKDKRGEIQKTAKGEAFIEREHLFKTFDRRRSFPETSLVKLLKELSRYQNQKYVLIPEPPKGFAAMEAELLRTVSPEETCAFEAMESGWHNLIGNGVRKLTHPSQANVRAAAEKTGLASGPAVGAFIWSQLLRVPWYKSQVMIAAQRQQKKELIQVLSSARIANDLREGGTVMENRVSSLTSAEAANVLVNQYRVQTRKIPQELEARKAMVLELATKKSRGMDAVDYQTVIAGVIEKQRNIGSNRTAAGAGVTAAVAAGGFMIIPLEDQLAALERGDVSRLPREVNRATPQDEPSSSPKAASGGSHGQSKAEANSRHGKSGGPSPNPNRSTGGAKPVLKISAGANGTRENKTVPASDAGKKISTLEAAGSTAGGSGQVVVKKKVKKTSIKLTRTVKNADGTTSKVVETITDPEQIEFWKNKNRSNTSSGGANKKAGGDGPATSKPSLKLNINVRKLSETGGNKAPVKKKVVSGSSDRKRGTSCTDAAGSSFKKKKSSSSASPAAAGVQKLSHKGSLGKITINQKAVREAQERKAAKRKRSQSYEGDDLDNPMRKAPKKGSTSRRKRNGAVTLNGILGEVEAKVRASEGYIVTFEPEIRIARVKPGVDLPEGKVPTSLTTPKNTALDLTKSVESKSYKDVVKKQMYFDLIRRNCQQTKYKSAADFLGDFALMVRNAQAFNQTPEVKWVIQHTQLLEEIARECVADSRAEIDAAESILKAEMKPSRVEV